MSQADNAGRGGITCEGMKGVGELVVSEKTVIGADPESAVAGFQ